MKDVPGFSENKGHLEIILRHSPTTEYMHWQQTNEQCETTTRKSESVMNGLNGGRGGNGGDGGRGGEGGAVSGISLITKQKIKNVSTKSLPGNGGNGGKHGNGEKGGNGQQGAASLQFVDQNWQINGVGLWAFGMQYFKCTYKVIWGENGRVGASGQDGADGFKGSNGRSYEAQNLEGKRLCWHV